MWPKISRKVFLNSTGKNIGSVFCFFFTGKRKELGNKMQVGKKKMERRLIFLTLTHK